MRVHWAFVPIICEPYSILSIKYINIVTKLFILHMLLLLSTGGLNGTTQDLYGNIVQYMDFEICTV